ncbi:MAG: thiamine phosphate synthase [Desulfuromusa sp.]|jgi:thiamine-phosphate pyrophosphorylase|nr:thiamine phosphate synthase [Desulfuromusa sp.]
MTESLPNLYLITDRHQTPKGRQLLEVIEELLQAGVKMVQLREKDLSVAELYPLAKQLRSLTDRYKSLLLINDRIDLAQAIGADGVHLGSHSLPIKTARQILGLNSLIGVSTHSAQEVELAQKHGANFVTYGPVYFTPSKQAYGEPVGIESLQSICASCNIPVYALGGVKANNTKATLQTGAHGVAMISSLLANPSPTQAYQGFAVVL